MGADVSCTISNLIVTSVYDADKQALAGGVFDIMAQFGSAIGLTFSILIANTITENSSYEYKTGKDALMGGYRGSYWSFFAISLATMFISVVGLRRIGKMENN